MHMVIRAFHPFFYLLICTTMYPCVHLLIFSFFLPQNIIECLLFAKLLVKAARIFLNKQLLRAK